jgi:nucleotide-binding universal stress UspA family protein
MQERDSIAQSSGRATPGAKETPVTTQRILIPLDGSALAERAIPFARALAGDDGTLTFLHVVPDPEPLRGVFGERLATADDVLRMERESATALMEETANRWIEVLGKGPSIYIAPGDPGEVVLQAARETGATMIAMASHGRGVFGRIAFGSVADRVSRTSDLPVLIVHPKEEETGDRSPAQIRRLIVPLDGSEIANEALPVARDLAMTLGCGIHLVQAIDPSALLLPSPVGAAHYPAELYQEIAAELAENARQTLREATISLDDDGPEVTQAVIEGPPVSSIEAEVQEGDLIVMTTHGRSGVQRWLLGSVSSKLIRSGVAPVVLVPASDRADSTRSHA